MLANAIAYRTQLHCASHSQRVKGLCRAQHILSGLQHHIAFGLHGVGEEGSFVRILHRESCAKDAVMQC